MSKRRATGQLTPAVTAKRHEAIPGDRARLFSARLKSINQQFAEWVKGQATSCSQQLWLDGVQHYQEYVGELLEEFKDILGEDSQLNRQRDVNTPVPDTAFGTPLGAAAAGSRDKSAAPTTGGSTGRRSVTWADASTALTPAPAAGAGAGAANGTPGPNTTNAGHTPAPPNFGRVEAAGTPGGSDMPTPQFKLPPASNAGTPAATPASRFTFGSSSDATPAAAEGKGADAAAAAAAKTPSSTGGFAWGAASGGFGTPVTAEPDKPAKGTEGSSPPVFAFGTPAASAFGTPAAAGGSAGSKAAGDASADKAAGQQQQPRAFTFGTPAAAGSDSDAAAGKGSTPVFGAFGSGSSDADASKAKDTGKAAGASPPAFSFGVPASGAAASSCPAFGFGAASSSAAAAADGSAGAAGGAAGDKGKAAGFSFGVTSSSGAAAAAGASPGFVFGTPGSTGAGGGASSSSPAAGGFSFGASSSGAAASSSAPAFAFGSAAPSFGAGGSGTPAFGTPGASPSFGFGAASQQEASTANGAAPSSGFTGFNFPKPAEGAGAGAGGAEEGEAEETEEKTQVQADSRYNLLFGKTGVLYISLKNDKGAYEWQNRGKGQVSVRTDKATAKAYVCFNLDGQGKQLVMHEIRGRDKPQLQTGKKDRVLMCLLNTLYSSKKNEDTGLPEPVVTHEFKNCVVRFGSGEAAEEFIALVEKHKPEA